MSVNILAIYIFILSLVPCCNGGADFINMVNSIIGIEQVCNADNAPHSDDCCGGEEDESSCTPFCALNCCPTSVDKPTKFPLVSTILIPVPSSIASFIPNLFSSAVTLSIWQPPKFC